MFFRYQSRNFFDHSHEYKQDPAIAIPKKQIASLISLQDKKDGYDNKSDSITFFTSFLPLTTSSQ